jgi:hypothetical protein
MNSALSRTAVLILLSPIALCQVSYGASDCATLKYSRHKVSSLSGTVAICSGDICGGPSVYELDEDITVQLRTKNGIVLDAQKVVFESSQKHGTKQDGTAITFEQKERRFSFEGKQDGDYLLAFILYKNGIAQPAVIFPTNYSHKRNKLSNSYYMVEPTCPSASAPIQN